MSDTSRHDDDDAGDDDADHGTDQRVKRRVRSGFFGRQQSVCPRSRRRRLLVIRTISVGATCIKAFATLQENSGSEEDTTTLMICVPDTTDTCTIPFPAWLG